MFHTRQIIFFTTRQNFAGTEVLTISAKDRDSGDFGTAGLVYELTGSGAELFRCVMIVMIMIMLF